MTNCPNCGAIVTGYRCESCETVFAGYSTEKDKLVEMASDYCDVLDKFGDDYKRLALDLRTLADERYKSFEDMCRWADIVFICTMVIPLLLIVLKMCGI